MISRVLLVERRLERIGVHAGEAGDTRLNDRAHNGHPGDGPRRVQHQTGDEHQLVKERERPEKEHALLPLAVLGRLGRHGGRRLHALLLWPQSGLLLGSTLARDERLGPIERWRSRVERPTRRTGVHRLEHASRLTSQCRVASPIEALPGAVGTPRLLRLRRRCVVGIETVRASLVAPLARHPVQLWIGLWSAPPGALARQVGLLAGVSSRRIRRGLQLGRLLGLVLGRILGRVLLLLVALGVSGCPVSLMRRKRWIHLGRVLVCLRSKLRRILRLILGRVFRLVFRLVVGRILGRILRLVLARWLLVGLSGLESLVLRRLGNGIHQSAQTDLPPVPIVVLGTLGVQRLQRRLLGDRRRRLPLAGRLQRSLRRRIAAIPVAAVPVDVVPVAAVLDMILGIIFLGIPARRATSVLPAVCCTLVGIHLPRLVRLLGRIRRVRLVMRLLGIPTSRGLHVIVIGRHLCRRTPSFRRGRGRWGRRGDVGRCPAGSPLLLVAVCRLPPAPSVTLQTRRPAHVRLIQRRLVRSCRRGDHARKDRLWDGGRRRCVLPQGRSSNRRRSSCRRSSRNPAFEPPRPSRPPGPKPADAHPTHAKASRQPHTRSRRRRRRIPTAQPTRPQLLHAPTRLVRLVCVQRRTPLESISICPAEKTVRTRALRVPIVPGPATVRRRTFTQHTYRLRRVLSRVSVKLLPPTEILRVGNFVPYTTLLRSTNGDG